MTSHCGVRLLPGRVIIRMAHDTGVILTELTLDEATQVRDLLTRAIEALGQEPPFPESMQIFIDAFRDP